MSTIYYCWVCDRESDALVPPEPHYEEDRMVRFCSFPHREAYLALAAL